MRWFCLQETGLALGGWRVVFLSYFSYNPLTNYFHLLGEREREREREKSEFQAFGSWSQSQSDEGHVGVMAQMVDSV